MCGILDFASEFEKNKEMFVMDAIFKNKYHFNLEVLIV